MTLLAELSIMTYGGGEILQKIFQAISMLFNGGQGGLMRPLMVICASFGGFYAIAKALFNPCYETFFIRYFFPLLVIGTLFLIPTTTVHIEDVLTRVEMDGQHKASAYTVSHVPLLLGKFAELVSSIGYFLAQSIENVMHMPNDPTYNSTGMIFASESALDMQRYQLTNANLEQNLRLFAKQCVLYDIALGRYTLDDVKKETDLWQFFEERTSQVRMIRYCPPEAEENSKQCSYQTCQDALIKMKPYFAKEKAHYAALEIGKHLPLTFQALTKLQKSSQELIGQQLTLNVLTDTLSKGDFAKKRAHEQQRWTFLTTGAMVGKGLVYMRIVIEALTYAAFIFILPISLLPGGLKSLVNWAWFTVWIQLWPPLYTILNYIMLIAGRSDFAGWWTGLSKGQEGLSLFTSVGLQNLNEGIFGIAGFLGLSIPFLSYVLLQGGLSSFVQLAGSLMAPAQGAAGAAAAEQATGNYSFANTNFGQTSFGNTSAFQTQLSPTLSSGYLVDNQGDMSTTYSRDASPIVTQSSSVLRTGMGLDETIGQSFQTQKQAAESQLHSVTDSYLESLATSSRISSDYITHLAHGENFNDSYSGREGYATQNSAHYLQSVAENWGKQYGFNAKESLDILASASGSMGMGGSLLKVASLEAKLGGSGSYQCGASRDEVMNSALNVAGSEGFQKNLQQVHDYARLQSTNTLDDEGTRQSWAYLDAHDQLHNQQFAYAQAQSRLDQISENASWFEQNAHGIKRSLNDDFMKWASGQVPGGYSQVQDILSHDQPEEVQPLVQQFIHSILPHQDIPALDRTGHMQAEFQGGRAHIRDQVLTKGHQVIETVQEQQARESGSGLKFKSQTVEHAYSQEKEHYLNRTGETQERLANFRDNSRHRFESENEKYLADRAWKGPDKSTTLSNRYQVSEASLWMEE